MWKCWECLVSSSAFEWEPCFAYSQHHCRPHSYAAAISNLLLTNEYVIVIALDFSKAFDTVEHSKIAEKLSLLNMPPNFYNWVIDFLTGHAHCTKFNDVESAFRAIMASVIQGSGLRPFAYIVTASGLRPITTGNDMFKFTDDSSLVIPASNAHTREPPTFPSSQVPNEWTL